MKKVKHSFIFRRSLNQFKTIVLFGLCLLFTATTTAQNIRGGKKISTDLFGLFFEDINYSADGGLYAELIRNRSFEYNPTEQREWNPFSFWEYISPGFSYGRISVETSSPVHPNNPHYIVLDVEHVGHEEKYTGESGVGIKNSGFDGIVIRKGEKYNFSMFARQPSSSPVSIKISLQDPKGRILAENTFSTSSNEWAKYNASLTAAENHDTARLVILAITGGKFALDVVSLFPEKTLSVLWNNERSNGIYGDITRVQAFRLL